MHPILLISQPPSRLLAVLVLALTSGAFFGARLFAADAAPVPVVATADAKIGEPVTEFFKDTTVARLAAIELGRIAVERDSSPSVKNFAKGVTSQESLLLERLQALATKLEVPLPIATSEKYAEKLGRLEAKSQAEFEKMFWDFLTELYQRDLNAFEFGATVQNAEVRKFAVQYRDMFQRQLDEIEQQTKTSS